MLPSVTATALYSSNAAFSASGAFLVIAGPANGGPLNTPTPLTQPSQAMSTFVGGPLAKWAAKAIRSKRIPVLAVRVAASAVSAFSAVSRTAGHGTSVVTVDGSSATTINAQVMVSFITGATIGEAGATYRVSIDGGRTFGVITALGTANSIIIALGEGNLTLNFGAGTIVSGEMISLTASLIAEGSHGTLDASAYPGGTNTAVASVTAATYPDDDYEVVVEFIAGGTLGTPGITYRTSISNGRTDSDWSQMTALGTALAIVIPNSGGFGLTLGTSGQTIGAGAVLRIRTYAPNFNTGSLLTALDALFLNKSSWEYVLLCGTVDAPMALTIDGVFASNFSTLPNGEKAWIANARMPLDGETETEYATAMQAISAAGRACYYGAVCAGDCKITDAITGYLHKRPVALAYGIEQASVTPNIDVARTDRPGLGVLLADENGNPDCHDESLYPGLDDYGFVTLRSQPEGIYVTNPRVFTPAGTDVEMMPHRVLLNLHTRIAKNYLRKVLSNDIFANKDGFILESEAKRLERGANDAENDSLRTPGWISAQLVTISRTDNLLEVKPPTLTASGQLQSKIYPKQISYTTQLVASIANPSR